METQAEIPLVAESHPLGRRWAQEESLHKPPAMSHALVPCLQIPPGTDYRSPVHKHFSALLLGGKGTEPAACPASPGHQALQQAPDAAAHPSWGLLAMRF